MSLVVRPKAKTMYQAKKKKACEKGKNCPYKDEYQHQLEYHHDSSPAKKRPNKDNNNNGSSSSGGSSSSSSSSSSAGAGRRLGGGGALGGRGALGEGGPLGGGGALGSGRALGGGGGGGGGGGRGGMHAGRQAFLDEFISPVETTQPQAQEGGVGGRGLGGGGHPFDDRGYCDLCRTKVAFLEFHAHMRAHSNKEPSSSRSAQVASNQVLKEDQDLEHQMSMFEDVER